MLKVLSAAKTLITDKSILKFTGAKFKRSLERINLMGCDITNASLGGFKALRNLRILILDNTFVNQVVIRCNEISVQGRFGNLRVEEEI